MKRLITALDTSDLRQAKAWAKALAPHVGALKLGLEFFLAHGRDGYAAMDGVPIFLDLKLHDIPNTVAGAVRSILPLQPAMLTVHASGGPDMVAAAKDAASRVPNPPLILAVTVLTSLNQAGLQAIGLKRSVEEQVTLLAEMAISRGADGLVCSPLEVPVLRKTLGRSVKLVVPGIRPPGADRGDQARTMTPWEAVQAGADWIVVGRPITASADPAAAASAIAMEIG
ncbi:MAG TPA: orotidine-5'-phosphate decarboxylase [Rhodopila sp.]|uniref:orotidine-5'-phosphate decarboxylase n=1 Tax=Rhodopila sp. TaxID=2480087 RepID=UPI002BA390F2|nr:orotidine-5'-phosphate decarboxylase [Rhodopila sp.]HVY16902.1 orotidine-5'-phosphate decarboxylase [Rhodopila sp.]